MSTNKIRYSFGFYGSLALIVLAGAILRIYHLDHLSFWYDELFSVTTSSKSFEDFIQIMKTETNPPFYPFLLFIWIKIFGNQPFTLRLFSCLIGIFTLPIVYFYVRKLTDKYFAISTVTFLSFSSGAIFYSQEVRSYSLLILLSSVTFFVWLRNINQKEGFNGLFTFIILSIFCSYTHYFGFIFVSLLWLFLLCVKWYGKRKFFLYHFICFLLINLLYLPEVYKILFLIPSLSNINWIPKPNLEIYIHFFSYIFYFFKFKKIPILLLLLISLVLPLLLKKNKIYIYKINKNKPIGFFFPTVYIIVSVLLSTYVISQFKPMVTSRNLLVLLTPVYFLVVMWYSSSLKLQGFRQSVMVILLSVLMSLSFSKYYYKDFLKEPWNEVTRYAIELDENDSIIFTYKLPDFIDYYLVDVYKEKPSKRITRSESDLDSLIAEARTNKVRKLIFIETSWDGQVEQELVDQNKNLEKIERLAKFHKKRNFIGFVVHHFQL
jgi:4-amino-4-deoxy-L-arabinose transferase-like glycosyltransferase